MNNNFLKTTLAERGIRPTSGRICGLQQLNASETRQAVQRGSELESASIAVPYYDVDGAETDFLRVKLEHEHPIESNGKRSFAKYLQPRDTSNKLYLCPLTRWRELLQDTAQPLVFTEGELKAMLLCQHQYACVGVAGVWGWRKRENDESSALTDLNQFRWDGRVVYIVFDSDVRTNRNVATARMALARELYSRGAKPYFVDLPHVPGASKTGVDDWWCSQGRKAAKEFRLLLEAASSPMVPSIKTTTEIAKRTLPEIDWIVPGLLSSGLASLSANPKTGKSFMALQLAHAVATGTAVFGYYEPIKGDALVLALEDTDRRIKNRMQQMGLAPTESLRIATSWPAGDDAYAALDRALEEFPRTRLVVIDTLQRFRKATTRGQNVYEADYVELALLKSIADRRGICILLIHHRRKGPTGDDIFSTVSGSAAITGAPDTNMVVVRERGSHEAVLWVSGRDIDEQSFSVSANDKLIWKIEGEAVEHVLSRERECLLTILTRAQEPMGLKDLADEMGDELGKSCSTQNARKMLRGLINAGHVAQPEKGSYLITEDSKKIWESSQRRIRKITGG